MSQFIRRQRSSGEVPRQGGTIVGADAVLALTLEGQSASQSTCDAEDQLIELMNQHERPIYTFLLSLVRDADIALDCTQDTFLRAYENLRRRRQVKTSWLYKVARNRAMDEFRRQRRVQPDIEKLDQIPVYESTDQALVVQQVMAQLSTTDREVLYLFDVAGFKTDEIGEMLGVRGSAVRQRLARARERFRLLYGAEP